MAALTRFRTYDLISVEMVKRNLDLVYKLTGGLETVFVPRFPESPVYPTQSFWTTNDPVAQWVVRQYIEPSISSVLQAERRGRVVRSAGPILDIVPLHFLGSVVVGNEDVGSLHVTARCSAEDYTKQLYARARASGLSVSFGRFREAIDSNIPRTNSASEAKMSQVGELVVGNLQEIAALALDRCKARREKTLISALVEQISSVEVVSGALCAALDRLHDFMLFEYADIWAVGPETATPSGLVYKLGNARASEFATSPLLACHHDESDVVRQVARTNCHINICDLTPTLGGDTFSPRCPDARSTIAVPLALGDKVLGVIRLESALVASYDEDDVECLYAVSRQISARIREAVAQSLVATQGRDYQSRFLALEQLAREIGANRTLEDLFGSCAKAIPKTLRGCDYCHIVLYDEPKQVLHLLGAGSQLQQSPGQDAVPNVIPVSESVTGRAVKEEKPIIIYGLKEHSDFYMKELRDRLGLCSMVCMPMFSQKRDRLLGVINIYSTSELHRFLDADVTLLAEIADVVAVAVINVERELVLAAEKRAHDHIDNTVTLGGECNLDNLAALVCEVIRAQACSVFLLNSFQLQLCGTTGITDITDYSKVVYNLGEGMTGWVGKTGNSIRLIRKGDVHGPDAISGLTPTHKFIEHIPNHPASEHLDRGFLCVPVMANNHVVGVIRAYAKRGDLPFTDLDQKLLDTVSGQLSASLLRRESTRARDRRWDGLITLVEQLRSNADERDVLRTAVRLAMSSVQADTGSIALYHETDNHLHFEVYEPFEWESRAFKEHRLATAETLIGEAYRSKNPINDGNMRREGHKARPIHPDSMSSLLVRLTGGGQELGVLACDSFQENYFSAEDEATLKCIAQMVATIIVLNRLQRQQRDTIREQDDLMAALVHQLVAPIAGMQSYCARMASDECMSVDSWNKVRSVLATSSELVANIALNFSAVRRMLDKPTYKLASANLRLPQMLIRVASLCQPAAWARKVNIVVEEDKLDMLPHIQADESLLPQVFLNLLDNAVKYSLKNTTIRVFLHDQSETNCIVCVQSTGVPIHEEDLERIFARGYRTALASKWSRVGTGLGLDIARQICEKHSAKIWAASTPLRDNTGASLVSFFVRIQFKQDSN